MRTAKYSNHWTGIIGCLTAGVLAVGLIAPAGVEGATWQASSQDNSFAARLATPQPSPAPATSSYPASPDLEALRAQVQRLQLLVARLQHAIYQLQQPEFDPASTPALLDPLDDLQDLFPDLAHRLCLAASPAGPGYLPGFCPGILR